MSCSILQRLPHISRDRRSACDEVSTTVIGITIEIDLMDDGAELICYGRTCCHHTVSGAAAAANLWSIAGARSKARDSPWKNPC